MKKLCSITLFCLTLAFMTVAASIEIGTPESVINDVLKQETGSTSLLLLPTCCGGDIRVYVDSYEYNDGWLSLSGKALERVNSEFMLRGDKDNIFGWIQLKDDDIVYRYSTDENKQVIVEQVTNSDILSVNETIAPKSGYTPVANKFRQDELPPVEHVKPYNGEQVNKLQSKPGAPKVIWMDIRSLMNGDTPKPDRPGEEIWSTWQIVSAGLSMFDVNVTTDKSVYDATGPGSRGFATFKYETGRSFCYVNAFGSSRGCTVFWQSNGYGTGRTAIHEYGHLLGVPDYGTATSTYFPGFSEFKWVPIMGNYWSGNSWGEDALYQWCKGEYEGANYQTDFFKTASRHVSLLSDDHTATVPLNFTGTSTISMVDNYGRIGIDDSDDFSFEILGEKGEVDLKIERIEHIGSAMLDVHAEIIDAANSVVIEDNPKAARNATLTTELPKGTYTLRISGGEEGTPGNGFSTYGSLGYYGISGTIDKGATKITNKLDFYIGSNVTLAENTLVFNNSQGKAGTISFYSVSGRKIVDRNFTGMEHKVSISTNDFSSGTVIYKISAEGQTIYSKMIIR